MSCTTVKIDVTHENYPETRWAEIRLDREMTIAEVKERLHRHVGTAPGGMRLYMGAAGKRWELTDGSVLLGSCMDKWYQEGGTMMLHVDDVDKLAAAAAMAMSGVNSDVSERYRMPDDVYAERCDNARNFIKSIRAAKRSEEGEKENDGAAAADSQSVAEALEETQRRFSVGCRCEVQPGRRRGEVAWVGKLIRKGAKGPPAVKVGVKLDEPLGTSDGRHPDNKEMILFECDEKYGILSDPCDVATGDFPPLDPFDLDEL